MGYRAGEETFGGGGGMKSILDPKFKYIPAAATDLAKTFARIRAEQKKREKPANVTELRKKEA